MQKILFACLWFCSGMLLVSCKKSTSDDAALKNYKLGYGDSVIYLKNTASDHIVFPVERGDGVYTAFPEGIELDRTTGAINVSKSETGLRYRIKFTPNSGKIHETTVLLSGVNYADHYHVIASGDIVSVVIYNGGSLLPSSSFDIDNSARNKGLAIDPSTGAINLQQSVRNGLFGSNPQNDVRKEVEVKYRISDASNNTTNSIKLFLYWYQTMNDVPADLKQLLVARQGMFFRGDYLPLTGSTVANAKPRPPCVIVIAE